MEIMHPAEATRIMAEEQDEYNNLPIIDAVYEDGTPYMQSVWKPTPEELTILNSGGFVYLNVSGVQPPPVYVFAHPSIPIKEPERPTIFVDTIAHYIIVDPINPPTSNQLYTTAKQIWKKSDAVATYPFPLNYEHKDLLRIVAPWKVVASTGGEQVNIKGVFPPCTSTMFDAETENCITCGKRHRHV